MDDRVERLPFARLLRNSALELLLTLFMLFGVTSIIRWVIGPSPISGTIPQIQVELLIMGTSVGILITGLILSPLGRITGGHMNGDFIRDVAIWSFPGSGCGALYRCPIARVRSRRCGSVCGLGPSCGRAAGSLRGASARTRLVNARTFPG
jgi:hypothetical protein